MIHERVIVPPHDDDNTKVSKSADKKPSAQKNDSFGKRHPFIAKAGHVAGRAAAFTLKMAYPKVYAAIQGHHEKVKSKQQSMVKKIQNDRDALAAKQEKEAKAKIGSMKREELIIHSAGRQIVEFEQNFNELMQMVIREKLIAKKEELAESLFTIKFRASGGGDHYETVEADTIDQARHKARERAPINFQMVK